MNIVLFSKGSLPLLDSQWQNNASSGVMHFLTVWCGFHPLSEVLLDSMVVVLEAYVPQKGINHQLMNTLEGCVTLN